MKVDTIRKDVTAILEDMPRNLEGENVLVTGGSGFLGSWLCETFVKNGASVTCADNLSTGQYENIKHLKAEKNFKFAKLDVSSRLALKEKFNYVLHFASRASPEEYSLHPIETLEANSLGTKNILELARRNDATVVYASSSEVYGNPSKVPTPETYWGYVNPVGPRSCYDEGKRFGEALCMAYYKDCGLDVKITRIFNTYGPRIRADGAYARAVPRFIIQSLTNRDITIYGNGSQTRAFCYVTDTISGINKALLNGAKGEIYNIGSPKEMTLLEFAEKVKELVKSSSQLVFEPLPIDDPVRRCPDISKAKSLLKWEPKVSLNEGLLRTIEWFAHR